MNAKQKNRTSRIERETRETKIIADINIDGSGVSEINTGIGFLDHMLECFSRHSLIDIKLKAEGDLHVDQHHTTEDTGIVIGSAIAKALGDFSGVLAVQQYQWMKLSQGRLSIFQNAQALNGRYLFQNLYWAKWTQNFFMSGLLRLPKTWVVTFI